MIITYKKKTKTKLYHPIIVIGKGYFVHKPTDNHIIEQDNDSPHNKIDQNCEH